VSRFGDDGAHRVRAAKMLGTVLHLHRGTPYVYQGEELGMTNAPFRGIEDFRDIEPLNHYAAAFAQADPDSVLHHDRRLISGEAADVPEALEWAGAELLVPNCPPPVRAGDHRTLRPWEARVYRRGG
jgi:glycosidase